MKRRKALRQIGMGLTAGLLTPQLFSSCKKENHGPFVKFNGSVAIIGAGAAGLYAADILNAQGINVFVLEARNNLGGRIRSFSASDAQTNNSDEAFIYDYTYPPVANFPLELGGELIYGSDSAWGKIVSVLNLPTADLSTSTNQIILDNLVKAAADWQGDPDYSTVESFVSGLSGYSGSDVSVASAAGVSTRGQALLNSLVGNYFGSSPNRISALGLANELKARKHDSKILTVKTNAWQDILLSRFNGIVNKVSLNTPVATVDYSGDVIVITDKSGKQYEAKKVIIAVPLTILKSNGIVFTPALPSTNTSAAVKFGMDACIRMIIEFKKNFWGDADSFIWGGAVVPQYLNTGFGRGNNSKIPPEENYTLTITVCGQAAESMLNAAKTPNNIPLINQVLTELDQLYPDPTNAYPGLATKWVRKKLIQDPTPHEGDPIVTIYNWTNDPYIQGGYSYPLVGATPQDRIDLGTAVPSGKIFFAGEATDILGDAGTVSGALQSAERATQELIKSITG